jgi:hypothetical protein
MSTNVEIYLKSAVRRWKRELQNGGHRVLVFSPYLTSETAELVLRAASPQTCEIHTVFSAEHFANGGSSIRTLKLLANEGYSLFDLPGLHAKIVLVSGQFVTIGSQNLTRGGTRNREASVVLTDPVTIGAIEKALTLWLSARTPINAKMIADLEALLPKLVRNSSLLRKQFARADGTIKINQARRERERGQAVEVQRRSQDRLRKFRARLATIPRGQKEVVARVHTVVQMPWFSFSHNQNNTLLAKPHDNLTRWTVGEEVIRLGRLTRYLCLKEDDGKFGWARVGKTRITFVHSRITGLNLIIGEWNCNLELEALSEELVVGNNLRIRLSPPNSTASIEVVGWFAINSFSISSIIASRRTLGLFRLRRWIDDHKSEFRRLVVARLVEPFHYEHNRAGVEATGFFGPVGTRMRLRIGMIENNPVLQAKTV